MPAERNNVLAATGLIVLMVLGCLVLWLAVPVAWLWLGSQIDRSFQASFRAYGAIAVGLPLTMLLLFALLRRVDLVHQGLTGTGQSTKKLAPAWRRSLSEERDLHAPTSALDIILAVTAVLAVTALVVWFFLFAGSPLPSSV
jgi:hypothetical protein